uniref:Cytochrome P450 n=1 Tax=Oryza punctata TaxID=4537 RepID=A0A0E0LT00_ORYPU
MAQFTSMQLPELLCSSIALLIAVLLYFLSKYKRNKNPIPTEWPIVGMLPGLLANRHNIHDFAVAMLAAAGRNLEVRGPPATRWMRFFTTSDPENVRHIFTTNFGNYQKGKDFAEVFGVLAGTIVTVDGEPWRRQRAKIHRILTRPELLPFIERSCRDKVADYLVPWLARMANAGTPFDMEDLLGRLVMDLTVLVVFGMDPCLLSADTPPMQLAGALDTLMEVAFYRQIMPAFCWKLMRRLNVGPERKYAEAEALLRRFAGERIARRIAAGDDDDGEVTGAAAVDILSHYIDDPEFRDETGEPTDFLHRTFINFLVALRDPMSSALPWLVYNLATHPRAVSALREELAPIAARKSGAAVIFESGETKHLAYHQAALFESLRLYPVGPIERKEAVADDVMPSGHAVRAGDTVLISVYGMGRLEDEWGEDCREFRPERWLTGGGGGAKLRHVPSYKFMAFNTGPRLCLGKKVSVATITPVVATLFWNFDVEVMMMDGHAVEQKLSVVLQMKDGFMVKVRKRHEI